MVTEWQTWSNVEMLSHLKIVMKKKYMFSAYFEFLDPKVWKCQALLLIISWSEIPMEVDRSVSVARAWKKFLCLMISWNMDKIPENTMC